MAWCWVSLSIMVPPIAVCVADVSNEADSVPAETVIAVKLPRTLGVTGSQETALADRRRLTPFQQSTPRPQARGRHRGPDPHRTPGRTCLRGRVARGPSGPGIQPVRGPDADPAHRSAAGAARPRPGREAGARGAGACARAGPSRRTALQLRGRVDRAPSRVRRSGRSGELKP